MWKIKHIFDGAYGCEERSQEQEGLLVEVTLVNERQEERYETVLDSYLVERGLDIGSIWPMS